MKLFLGNLFQKILVKASGVVKLGAKLFSIAQNICFSIYLVSKIENSSKALNICDTVLSKTTI